MVSFHFTFRLTDTQFILSVSILSYAQIKTWIRKSASLFF